jgi:hypothetical protein
VRNKKARVRRMYIGELFRAGCRPGQATIRTVFCAGFLWILTPQILLGEEHHPKWLGEVKDADLKALLKPFPADPMRIWAISPKVNSPENNDPEIIVPIPSNYQRLETDRTVAQELNRVR